MRSLEEATTAVDTIVKVPQRCSIYLSLDGCACVCVSVCVCVCVCGATAISESFSLAAQLLLLLFLLLLLAAYIISNGCNLQPAVANTSWHRIGQPCGALREKKTAQSQSEKPQTKAKVVMPRNGLNVQPVGRQCRRPDRHEHGQWQGQGQRQQQQYKQRTQLAQGGARCVYAMHTLAYDN